MGRLDAIESLKSLGVSSPGTTTWPIRSSALVVLVPPAALVVLDVRAAVLAGVSEPPQPANKKTTSAIACAVVTILRSLVILPLLLPKQSSTLPCPLVY